MKNKIITLLLIGFMTLFIRGVVPPENFENSELSEAAKLLQEANIEELVARYVLNITNLEDGKEILSFIRKDTNNFPGEIPWPYDNKDADRLVRSLSFVKKVKDRESIVEDLLNIQTHYKEIKNLPPSKQIKIYIQAEVCTAEWTRAYPSDIMNILKKCLITNHLELVK
ncbi:MAG TPA: hypothetical protein VL201_04860 [Patescibacteria group bacterium]|jgi:hypothetical protein|nr:hypothetical protein [Patescibacteria group bacterium]